MNRVNCFAGTSSLVPEGCQEHMASTDWIGYFGHIIVLPCVAFPGSVPKWVGVLSQFQFGPSDF